MTTSNKIFSTTDLLKTNSLTRQQIFERLDLIKNLLENDRIEFTAEEENKLQRLIDKSRYLDEDSTGKARDDEDELESVLRECEDLTRETRDDEDELELRQIEIITKQKSEKYLTKADLVKIARNTREISNELNETDEKVLDLKIREQRTGIRITSSGERLKEAVYANTEIVKNDDSSFSIQYPFKTDESENSKKKDKEENSTNFLFSVKFRDDKVEFIFEKTFKESDPKNMRDEDRLYPEEIQITMLKKLIDSNAEVLEKLRDARKINCIRSSIINEETLLRMSKYLELRSENPNDHESKKYLSSSPNQSNTQNFINQLKHVFGIKISNSTPPSVICGPRVAESLKQSFKKKLDSLGI